MDEVKIEPRAATATEAPVSREALLHALYEAAELEHNLMCTYLYAAFSLRSGTQEGLLPAEAEAVARWRRTILDVAIDEMGHLVAVWNITAALGGTPRFGRANFPLDPGVLPAGVIVRLAPFGEAVLQHFVHLERPEGSVEPDGEGFAPDFLFSRVARRPSITPMAMDYETVGVFYATLSDNLRRFVDRLGESVAFCGDPALQLSAAEIRLTGAQPVICSKTALAGFAAIIVQGEGAPSDAAGSHFQKFTAMRTELAALKAARADFSAAFPAATNPVLRTPMRPTGRVWIEDEDAAAAADVANACYALMLRLVAYAYAVPRPHPHKALAVDLSLGLMRAMTHLAERAARLPAGPSNPHCNAGMSFVALRDAAPLPVGPGAAHFFRERLAEIEAACIALGAVGDARADAARRQIAGLVRRAAQGFAPAAATPAPPPPPLADTPAAPPTAQTVDPAGPVVAAATRTTAAPDSLGAQAAARATAQAPAGSAAPTGAADGVERVEGQALTLTFHARRCIHARFCVTGAPKVFLANVQGPWIFPDAMPVAALVEIAHACPSGAIGYVRKDGVPDEAAPPVNLLSVREAGPYAVRAPLRIRGQDAGFRATLCRCGASKNKPYCDGSHHEIGFSASGEPATGQAETLAARDGVLEIEPQTDGPLQIRGNLEILSGTGRMVTRVTLCKLCRCGGSATKPFCDGTHARIGFVAD